MKRLLPLVVLAGMLGFPLTALAASNSEVANFTHNTLTGFIVVATIATVFFLVRGAYLYITSTGKPEALVEAKSTIRNALIGLAIVIGAGIFSSILNGALTSSSATGLGTTVSLTPIAPAAADGSLTQILLDAISGFLQNIIESATKPITDGLTAFLTNTPVLETNSVVFNFWLVMVGITDSLFALVIALLGFRVMSASSFGFEELSLKQLLPRIAVAFLIANTSIFLIDGVIALSQTLIHAVLDATGGLSQAWITNAFDPSVLASGGTAFITLIFMIVFVLLAAVLLLFYISRLMILAFGAVVSPLVCLIWLIPSWSDFAESAFKTYIITIFILFVQVVIIQLASAFLTVSNQDGTNPLISILIGVALLSILLKSSATAVQLALTSQVSGTVKKLGGQVLNVIAPATGAAKAGVKA